MIAGHIDNWRGHEQLAKVNLCNPIDQQTATLIDLESDGGEFCVTSDYLFPQDVRIAVGNRWAVAFVSPGDSIFVHVDYATGAASFSGGQAALSSEINDWCHRQGMYDDVKLPVGDDIKKALTDNFAAAQKRIAASGMSRRAQAWALRHHKFVVANNMEYRGDDKWDVLTDSVLFDPWNRSNFEDAGFSIHLFNAPPICF